MAQTNVQAFSGDVEIANTLTVSDDIIVDDGTNHSLTIDPTTSMIYNKQIYFVNVANNSYNYLGRFRVYAPPAIFNIWDTGSALGSGSRYSMSKGYGQPQSPIVNALEGSEFSTYRFYWEPEAAGGGDEEDIYYHVWFSPSRAGDYTFYIHAKSYTFPTEPSSPTYNDVIYGMLNLLGSNGTQSHVVVGRPSKSGNATLQLHNESQVTGDRLTHEAIQLFSNTTPTAGDFSNVFITMTPSITNGGYGGYIEGWIKSGTSSGLSLGNISQGTKYRGLTITSQGSVGIGTTNPQEALHVAGNIRLGAAEGVDDDNLKSIVTTSPLEVHSNAEDLDGLGVSLNLRSGFSDSESNIQMLSSKSNSTFQYISFATATQERMRITSGGNVGIGKTDPGSALDVVGDVAISSDLVVGEAITISNTEDTGFSNVIALSIQAKSSDHTSITNGYGSRIQFRTNRGTNQGGSAQSADIKGYVWSGAGGGQDYHALDLNVYGDNSSLNRGISILSNSPTGGPAKTIMHGYVGIGRDNPACALDIAGEDVMIRGNTPSLNFSEGTGAMDGNFRIRYDGVNQTDNNNFLAIQTGASFGVTALHCKYNGLVGIYNNNPASLLSVRGNYSNSQAPTTYNSAPPLCVVNPTSSDGQPICQFRTNQGVTNIRNDGLYHKRGNGDSLQLFTSSSNVRFKNGTVGNQLELHNNGTAYFNCNLRANNYNDNSDDRIKYNESSIKNAIQTLFKLKPQKYDKVSMDIDVLEPSQYLNATDKEGYEWNDIEDGWIKRKPITSSTGETETGLIAQDIWYDAPELRHIVNLPDDAIPDDTKPTEPDPGNIRSDPDYDSAGWGKLGPATVNYISLIPYMIKSIKELYNEVTRHKTRVPTELYSNVQNYRHMIVSKHGDNIQLANTENDKAVHGVISDIKTDTDNYEILIEHIGMGNVWVLNTGSNIEVGDYITTSNITGYGMLQDSTYFMNHTIGKSTIDCDFTVQTTPIKQKIRRLQDKTHWIKTKRLVHCSLMAYSNLSNDTRTTEIETYYNTYENTQGSSNVEQQTMQYIIDNEQPFEITESEMNFEKYSNTYTVNTPFHTEPQTRTNYYRKTFSKLENELEGYEPIVEQEMMDVLDDNGQVQWEDTGDTRPLYDLRYLTIDGSITDQSNAVYTASLVPISLHL